MVEKIQWELQFHAQNENFNKNFNLLIVEEMNNYYKTSIKIRRLMAPKYKIQPTQVLYFPLLTLTQHETDTQFFHPKY